MPTRGRNITRTMQRNARNGYTVLDFNGLMRNNDMYKKQYKKSLKKRGIAYNMSRGFYYTDDEDWDRQPEQMAKKKIKLPNGRSATVYDSGDRDGRFIPFSKMETSNSLEQYITEASFTWSTEGCGHIKQLDYAPRRSILRVEFQEQTDATTGKTWGRNDIAFYFNVPSGVFGELYYLAQSKVTQAGVDGYNRHALGIHFWDLVRIRGSLYGSRYPYSVTNVAGPSRGSANIPVRQTKASSAEKKLGLATKETAPKTKSAQQGYTDAQVLEELGSSDAAYIKKYLDSIGRRAPSGYSNMHTLGEKYSFLKSHNMLHDD